jgi:hypothetical protein
LSGEQELRVVKGNDEEFLVTVEAGGIPLNLSGVSIRCEVKTEPGRVKLFEAIVEPDDPANGKVRVKFPRTETEKLKEGSVIAFDLLIIASRRDCQECSESTVQSNRSWARNRLSITEAL